MASHVEFFSEFAQDRLLFERFFWNVRGRVFVDIDLRDGVCRNSLFFERNLDWSGLCLAATDIAVTGLKASRRAICERFPITGWQMDADQEANDAPENGLSALFETHSIRNVDYCSMGDGHEAGRRPPGPPRLAKEVAGKPRHIPAVRYRSLHAKLGGCLHADVGAVPIWASSGELCSRGKLLVASLCEAA